VVTVAFEATAQHAGQRQLGLDDKDRAAGARRPLNTCRAIAPAAVAARRIAGLPVHRDERCAGA
jgi:hypothetical protein